MDADPSKNMVVFQLGRGGDRHAVAEGATRDDDCVQQAWARAQREQGAVAAEVSALYSEWQPSPADIAFIRRTFPGAELTYSFARPAPGGWDTAFQAARRTMIEAGREREAEEAAERMRHVREHGELLPVLWSHASPKRQMLEYLPYRELVPGRLFVALATVAPTHRGTIGMNHVGHAGLAGRSFQALFTEATTALANGLQVNGHVDEAHPEQGTLLSVAREGPLASSAVVLPDFHERMARALGDDRVLVGLPEPDTLLVTTLAATWAGQVERAVLDSPCPAGELLPTLLLMTGTGVELLAERGGPPR